MSEWVLARLKEPSSWRGIVWLLTALGVSLSPEAWEYVIAAGMAIAGLIGVLSSERPAIGEPHANSEAPGGTRIGRADEADRDARSTVADGAGRSPAAAGGVRDLPSKPNFGVRPPIERSLDDQFSGGWGDR